MVAGPHLFLVCPLPWEFRSTLADGDGSIGELAMCQPMRGTLKRKELDCEALYPYLGGRRRRFLFWLQEILSFDQAEDARHVARPFIYVLVQSHASIKTVSLTPFQYRPIQSVEVRR